RRSLVVFQVHQTGGAYLLGGQRSGEYYHALHNIGASRRQRVIAERDLQQRRQYEVYRFPTTWDDEGDAFACCLQDGNEALNLVARIYWRVVAQDNVEVQVGVFIPVAARERTKERERQHTRVSCIVRCQHAENSLMARRSWKRFLFHCLHFLLLDWMQ